MGIRRTFQKAPEGLRSAREIANQVLRFLVEAAGHHANLSISRVVVTFPASFQTAQRKDTIEATKLAGIDIAGGDLLDEPVSAFLDFMSTSGPEIKALADDPKNLAVFDLGGGTCDVVILHLESLGGELAAAPLAVSRYHRLGGGEIDAAIVDKVLLPLLMTQNKIEPWDLSFDAKSKYIFPAYLGVAESLKIGLCMEIARLRQLGKYDPASVSKKLPGAHHCTIGDGRTLTIQDPVLSAKGLTLDSVLIPMLTRQSFAEYSEKRVRRFLFVASTRATKWLYFSSIKGGGLPLGTHFDDLSRSGHLAVQEAGVAPVPGAKQPNPLPKPGKGGISDWF